MFKLSLKLYEEENLETLCALSINSNQRCDRFGRTQVLSFYNKESYFIWHLMISEKYQNKGYGKQALNLLETFLHTFDHKALSTVALFYDKSNIAAKSFTIRKVIRIQDLNLKDQCWR